jgi:hypothetical protein
VKHGWNRISTDMDVEDAAGQSQHASGAAGDSNGDDDRAIANRHGSDSFERKTS